MLYTHFTEELLGLQGVKITNIEKEENNITIYLEMERKSHGHKGTQRDGSLVFPCLCVGLIVFYCVHT